MEKDTDLKVRRQNFVHLKVMILMSTKDDISTVGDALNHIADNLLFLSRRSVERIYNRIQ